MQRDNASSDAWPAHAASAMTGAGQHAVEAARRLLGDMPCIFAWSLCQSDSGRCACPPGSEDRRLIVSGDGALLGPAGEGYPRFVVHGIRERRSSIAGFVIVEQAGRHWRFEGTVELARGDHFAPAVA
jgi:hypothetical protein